MQIKTGVAIAVLGLATGCTALMSESEAKSANDWAAQVMLATQQQMQVMAAAQTAAFVDAQMVPPPPALPAPCP